MKEIAPEPVGIDCEMALDRHARLASAAARYSIMHDGKLLPVTNMYDSDGNETSNNFRAYVCVAFDSQLDDGSWVTISNLDPGDVLERACPSPP